MNRLYFLVSFKYSLMSVFFFYSSVFTLCYNLFSALGTFIFIYFYSLSSLTIPHSTSFIIKDIVQIMSLVQVLNDIFLMNHYCLPCVITNMNAKLDLKCNYRIYKTSSISMYFQQEVLMGSYSVCVDHLCHYIVSLFYRKQI